jgi:hypothetical protein
LAEAGPQLPIGEELQAELLDSLTENARLRNEQVSLFNRIEIDRTIVLDLNLRINRMADNVESLNHQIVDLNIYIDDLRERHHQQILSIQRQNIQHLARLETDHTCEKMIASYGNLWMFSAT